MLLLCQGMQFAAASPGAAITEAAATDAVPTKANSFLLAFAVLFSQSNCSASFSRLIFF